jgi:hypothetical protein
MNKNKLGRHVESLSKRSVQGFSGETRRIETTWETQS